MHISDLWESDGTITRTAYLCWGTSLLGIKYGIDAFVAEVIFHRAWSFWSYLFPGQTLDFLALSATDRAFFATMAAMAIPFIWVGVVLTVRRLRAVGLPVWLVYLFFVPFVNLMMFVLLSVLPTVKRSVALPPLSVSSEEEQEQPSSSLPTVTSDAPDAIPPLPAWPKPDRSLPGSKQLVVSKKHEERTEFIRALATTVPPSIAIAWLGIFVFKAYGWGIFLGLPFGLGLASAYSFGRLAPRNAWQSMKIALLAITLLGLGMFFFAWEGMACLVMAAPVVYTLAAMGAMLGHHMQLNRYRPMEQKLIPILLLFLMPTLMGAEYSAHVEGLVLPVTSVVEIDAPPAVVWNHVIAFPKLDPPDDPLFHLGIAYPIGATIDGAGVGAVRRCEFSTGAFIEPIKVWDAPHLLQFGVEAQPPSMREWSWMHDIHPAHLEGYLEVQAGQFKLEPIAEANGVVTKTRLIGTTWYKNRMFPADYWRMWSDGIIHRIHLRVLKHIRKNAEAEMKTTA
jgi:uncharacterized membrane protein YhaH (DUF805 family)